MMKGLKVTAFFALTTMFQSVFALNLQDKESIEKTVHAYVDTWNNHAGVGFCNDYAEECDFINIFGMHFSGKDAVERRHIEILETFLKGSHFIVENIHLKEVSPGFVFATIRWTVNNIGPEGDKALEGIFSHIYILENNEWKITAAQNTLSGQYWNFCAPKQ